MSASAEIFRFPGRAGGTNNGAWNTQDLADVYRCVDLFARNGLLVEASSGMSDEGDPWFALEDVMSGEAVVHIARIDGFFIVHVPDGDTWSGSSLRAALANLDVNSLVDLTNSSVDAGAADDDGDKDGSHAFLRIVSAVVAVLTADVIAGAVSQDAAASVMFDDDAPSAMVALTGSVDGNGVLDLPETNASTEPKKAALHTQPDNGAPVHEAKAAAPSVIKVKVVEVTADAGGDTQAATIKAAAKMIADDQGHGNDAQIVSAIASISSTDSTPAAGISFNTDLEHVRVEFGETASFKGSMNADLFLVVLDKNTNDITTKIDAFETGEDSLVVEKADDGGTSSGIILDLTVLTNGAHAILTVIGQEDGSSASAASFTLVGGG